MKLFRNFIAIVFALVVLAAAFVCVVVVTRPTPVQAPPTGVHSVKILSVQPIDGKTYFGATDSERDGLYRFYSLKIQLQDEPQGKTPPIYEWRYSYLKSPGNCEPPESKVVKYTGSASGGGLEWHDADGWICSGDVYPPLPPDPLLWFHNKENSLGLAVFGGIALLSLVALAIGIFAWLAPIYIAKKRLHPNFMPITVITIFLGWTFIGWVVCLAWSLSSVKTVRDSVPEPVGK
jgi:hypothetical protein